MNRSHLRAQILTGSLISVLLCAQPIAAQVVPDTTLSVGERSQISGSPNVQIDGGARRGGNLFHSFSQFAVPTGGSAYFNNAVAVQNIFSRVTGGSISNIDGLLRANGTANLFFLNSNGILFGPNASLNIGGSFVATTANAIGFQNGEVFSSDAAQPLPSQLLTVNPNAFFFNQLTPQPIIVQSRFDERVFTISSFNATGLHVPPGKNLLLVGGSIQLESGEPFIATNPPGRPLLVFFTSSIQDVQPDGGWLMSPGSYVELGAVGGIGTVGLSTVNADWQLTISNAVPRANISLSNGSGIYVTGASGSIRMLAQNIDISKSVLQTGILKDSRLPNSQTGDLDLNATGSIALSMSALENSLFGQGTLGSINLTASDRVFLDRAAIYSGVEPTGVGNAGNINISTGSLAFNNRASVQAYTQGQGNAGSINLNVRNITSFDNGSVYNVSRTGLGNAGDINIATGSLSLTNNAQLTSFQIKPGTNAGSINITARDTVSFTQNSGLASYVSGSGRAGSISVSAYNTVSLDNSNIINFIFGGTGSVGGINITTGAFSLAHGAQLFSTLIGQGNAGSVNINARDRVSIEGDFIEYTNGGRIVRYKTSGIFTQVAPSSKGQGGEVSISTGSLFLTNGGVVNTSTAGQGDAGRVLINARDVQIRGTAPTFTDYNSEVLTSVIPGARIYYRSGVYTSAAPRSTGNAGDVSINSGTLSVADQGRINTNAQGRGRAGNIQIQANDAVSFDRGDAISTLESGAVGNGGNIAITARSFLATNGAQLSVSTAGQGNAGNITIEADTIGIQDRANVTVSSLSSGRAGILFVDADRLYLNNQGSIRADTTGGGGDINVRSPFILLRNGSNITTNATGANIPGGNIGIDTRFLIAVLSEDSNISANSEDFRGGNVRIHAFSLFGIQPSPVSTPLSDITATGATSALSGTIDVITAGIDPTSGLVQLPTDPVEPGLIAQGCPADKGNSFVITGRGGLPPNPEQQLDDDAEWSDRKILTVAQAGARAGVGSRESGEFKIQNSKLPYTPIVEANAMQVTPTGEIFLVANASHSTVQNSLYQPVACSGSH
ncbi:MAG: filamentous hemagglutinin N-terminal domain-containing protein [Stenomitos rutilans HA7619-LM2]|jgi:filamentous hemagglutinin family protein|nr:filamentous hemagglutinin N-terminal domain-containing protein [Stenomitos rutilans HA7619-LM2]